MLKNAYVNLIVLSITHLTAMAITSFSDLQLSSLYETRPPISRAKMANVTKCAIKAIKFYKHVVQSVEKFILKVSPVL